MFFQQFRRFHLVSLGFTLFLVLASGVFVYLVSPLRDPNFQPNSANAGTFVPWLQGVTEEHWLLGAAILAFLVSTNLILSLWHRRLFNKSIWLVCLMVVICIWTLLFNQSMTVLLPLVFPLVMFMSAYLILSLWQKFFYRSVWLVRLMFVICSWGLLFVGFRFMFVFWIIYCFPWI